MKRLLSLPPGAAECFHEVTGFSRADYFCTSDPPHHRLGSGGGTVWALEACHRAEASDTDFTQWLKREKRVLLHAGGQSRRLPAYAPGGKAFIPVPVFRWARGQRIDQTLTDLQMPLYEQILDMAPDSLHTLVASGDVFIRTTTPLPDIPEADVVCYGLWADAAQAAHHGVFMMSRQCPDRLDFMLQKPTAEELAALTQSHFSLMDIGVWLLSDRAVNEIARKSAKAAEEGCKLGIYDIYGQFGRALGLHPSAPDPDLAPLTVAVLPLDGGEFYHFGTAPDLISSADAIQNLVKDQRFIIQKGVKRQSSVFTQNTIMANRPTAANICLWVENARLGEGWHFSSHNIVTGIPENDWNVTLADGQCLDIVPVNGEDYVLRPYGYYDAFRGRTEDPSTLFLGQPVKAWLKAHGLTATDIGGRDDIQTARLFPVSASLDELGRLLHWFLSPSPDAAVTQLWYRLPRLSADEISAKANLRRLFAQRRQLQSEILPALAANWQKSVFYQINLKDAAQKFATAKIEMPASLPEEAPLLTRIHDAMFRAEAARATGKDGGADEAKAFGLLRDGMVEQARRHKCLPRMTTCCDQIVWARSATRIDLAGGWTDTPPYSLLSGGNVVNMAIEMNGQPPLQVYVKPCKESVIICRSIDLGAMERIETYEELRLFNKVGSPFSIPKAALALAGFLPDCCAERFGTLRQQLEAMGCGLEITLLSAIPAGSGLGTSSILAATVLGALSNFCGLGWDKNEICGRTLVLEQLLTTGGGWQDQYGGVLHGVKLLQTAAGFEQSATARWIPGTLFSTPELKPCHLLYYTGVTRTAKHILADIVRGMFLNDTDRLRLLDDMKWHATRMFEALQLGDFGHYGSLLRRTWGQNRALDAGTAPPIIEELCRRIDDFCLGYKLPGAGGGGFMYMVAKDEEAARRIRKTLTENPLKPNARFVEMDVSDKGLQISRS